MIRAQKLISVSLVCAIPLLALDLSQPLKFTVDTSQNGVTSNKTFMIITIPGETYNYAVICQNGGDIKQAEGDFNCTYATEGNYTISISGIFPGFDYNGSSEARKFVSIDQWGDIVWKSMASAFIGAYQVHIGATDTPNLSEVTDMSQMFYGVPHVSGNFNSWDVSHVTNMQEMFYSTDFDENISNWDVSSVTNMKGMFKFVNGFNQDISDWNVSHVENMAYMFLSTSFNRDIGKWDVSRVTDMTEMFYATPFNQDIGDWNVSSVTTMNGMFRSAKRFNQDISGWNVARVTDMHRMFRFASSFSQDLRDWNVSQVKNMTYMFDESGLSTSHYDALLQGWQQQPLQTNVRFDNRYGYYCKAEDARQAITDTYGWNITDKGLNCSYYINSADTFNIKSGKREVGVITVANDTNISTIFSIIPKSADDALFDINTTNGQLRFKEKAVYHYNGDNEYHVLVQAEMDSAEGALDIQTVRVRVEPNNTLVPVINYLLD